MFVITCILAMTIFVVRFVATKALCPLEHRGNDVFINCTRQHLTDDVFTEIFVSLKTKDNKDEEDVIKNNSLVMLVEFNELQTLKVIPNTAQMIRVTRLSFKQNRIVSAETGVFRNLPALRELDLSYNQLTGSSLTKDIFEGKYNTSSLEFLNLENNNISTLNLDVFFYLGRLKSLILNQNPIYTISSQFEAAFMVLKDLQVLSITQTQLSALPDNFLGINKVIKELYMTNNRFTQVPKCFRNIGNSLQLLNLNGNPIQKLNAASFDMLFGLNTLHLNGMETLMEIAANTFSPLANLQTLECSYNARLQTIDSAAFAGLKNKWNIQELYLKNNGLRYLANDTALWDQLDALDLSGNPWNCTCSLKWLMNFTGKRQNSDPQSNFGMHCKYPQELNNKTLMYANAVLSCSKSNNPAEDSYMRHYYLTTTNLVLTMILITFTAISFYYVMKRIRRARLLKSRYSGTVVKSMVKYRRTRLDDYGCTRNDFEGYLIF